MSQRSEISVGVIGGGIGGLASALHLLQSDFDVHVYERAGALSDVGAGIQVSPNASRVLHRLGLAGELARMGVRPVAMHQRRWDDGRTLVRAPLGDVVIEAFGFPHYQIHRADLLTVLARALPRDRVHLAHRLVGLADRGDRVDVVFENGATIAVDVLVGADGIHSTVRGLVFGEERPRFTGCAAYRGLVPAERLAQLDLEVTAQIWLGPGRHFVHYFVRNRGLVNFVAVVEQDSWTRESWTDAVMSPTRCPRSRAGTPRSAKSWGQRTRRSSGRCLTALRCPNGLQAESRCSATRAIPCCLSWRRVQPRRWRTARR